MAGWSLFPFGSEVIYECNEMLRAMGIKGKVIGRFSHCKINRDGVLVGLKVQDGPEMKITKDTITVEGYEEPWTAVTYMTTNCSRMDCACWVWQLICEGKFEYHRESQDKAGGLGDRRN